MQAGAYECKIVDVGVDENKDGKEYVWLLIQPDGHSPEELKLWLHTDECRRISEANLRSLGWTGDWRALAQEIVNLEAVFNYGPSKDGQYMNWSFPYRSKMNESVLERLSITQAAKPRPKTAGKASAGRADGTTAKEAAAAGGDDIPF